MNGTVVRVEGDGQGVRTGYDFVNVQSTQQLFGNQSVTGGEEATGAKSVPFERQCGHEFPVALTVMDNLEDSTTVRRGKVEHDDHFDTFGVPRVHATIGKDHRRNMIHSTRAHESDPHRHLQ